MLGTIINKWHIQILQSEINKHKEAMIAKSESDSKANKRNKDQAEKEEWQIKKFTAEIEQAKQNNNTEKIRSAKKKLDSALQRFRRWQAITKNNADFSNLTSEISHYLCILNNITEGNQQQKDIIIKAIRNDTEAEFNKNSPEKKLNKDFIDKLKAYIGL